MSSTRLCGQCGAQVSGYSAEGLCPKCMLLGGLGLDDKSDEVSDKPNATSPPSEPEAKTRLRYFGDYEFLEEIARGGMGVVFKARQVSLNRIVAVKMILAGQLANTAALQRFLAEAEAAANLRHPNIVAIYEVGEHDGQHYFSMEYVEGQNLAALVREKPLIAAEAAQYVRLIAEAIQYAHGRGTLHRDLKPSNVLLDSFDQPRITDFGLAKQVTSESDLTLSGQVLGTPSFMPPEQASGKRGVIGPASDVYSVGAILYHLVTGRPPFTAPTATETLRLVEEAEPVSPRLLNPGVPRDLETICLKCLQKIPAKRYASAQVLADELGRFLRDEAIQARPVSAPEKLWRWCRRRPAVASLVATLLIVFTVGLFSVLFELRRAERAEGDSREKLRDSYLAQAQAARQTLQAGRRETILTAVRRATAIRPSIELRNEAIAALALTDLGQPRAWRNSIPTNGWRWQGWAAMDADLGRYGLGTPAGDLSVRRVADQQELLRLPKIGAEGYKLVFSGDGQYLAARHVDGWVRVWDLKRRRPLVQAKLSPALMGSLAFSPDSRWIAAGANSNIIHFYALTNRVGAPGEGAPENPLDESSATGTPPTRSVPSTLTPGSLHFDPSGHRLAVASGTQLQVWEWEQPRLLYAESHPSNVAGLAWHPDGRSFAAGSESGDIYLWHIGSGSHRVLRGHESHTPVLSFHPRGDVLASCSWDGTTRLWDIHTGQTILSTEQGFNIRFSRAGDQLAFYRENQELGIWPVVQSRIFRTLADTPGVKKFSDRVDFSPDGGSLLWNDDEAIWWLDLATGELRQRKASGVHRAIFDSGAAGTNVLTAGVQGLWRWPVLREVQSPGTLFRLGTPQMLMTATDGSFYRMEISASGRTVLTTPRTWTIAERDGPPRTFENQGAVQLHDVAISSDQRWVALGDWKGMTFVCDAQTGRVVQRWPGERSAMVGFTPDSHWLVTATGQEYRFWETGSWQPGWRYPRQLATAISGPMAFSRNGHLMALARTVRLVQLVDLDTGEPLADLIAPTPQIISRLAFSTDGSLLACSGGEGIQLWDLRALRQELAALHLDWDQPPYPPSASSLATVVFHANIDTPQLASTNFPPRPPEARAQLLDLTKFYNADLKETWLPGATPGSDLAELPSGVQNFGGTEFDVRGIVQLRSARPFDEYFPEQVEGIPLGQKCQRLHFLHATGRSLGINNPNYLKPLARYLVHYADGASEEIPVVYGRDVRNWWMNLGNPTGEPPPVWTGYNTSSREHNASIRLFHTAWENPHPDAEIRSLDFISTLTECAPFVIAITVE